MASSLSSVQQQPTQQTSIAQATSSSHQHQTLPGKLLGRELKLIASSFVKQYYTLLNKAPCFIHNFYNHDSTFIHGTIEMGSDNHTEPVVGREKIEEKMRELQLNDCRAKIKQIDCLETLAGGLVLQVIGELSNDGKPMRRFLQTFVLAPSPDQTRHDGDSHNQNKAHDNRRGVQISENSSNSSHNQKFYVLNSIFRYQDDGPDSEFEDDVSVKANTSVENGPEQHKNDGHSVRVKTVTAPQPNSQQPQKLAAPAEQPKINTKSSFASEPAPSSSEQQKRSEVKVVAPNGTTNSVRKGDISEKLSYENGKAPNESQTQAAPLPTKTSVENSPLPAATSQTAPLSAATPVSAALASTSLQAPRPSNEPKTWANMVRNALPPSSAAQPVSVTATKEQQGLTQSTQAHNLPQQQQIPHQQQPSQSQTENQQSNSNNNNNNNSNNRRRHMIRKTSNNKTGNGNPSGGGSGRTIKHKPARPATAAAPTSKPAA